MSSEKVICGGAHSDTMAMEVIMQIGKQRKGNSLMVSMKGELDHHNAAVMRQELDDMLTEDVRELILNMEGVTFMDSSGIGVVLGRYNRMKERGGKLRIIGAAGYVEKILRMAGVFSLVECNGGK